MRSWAALGLRPPSGGNGTGRTGAAEHSRHRVAMHVDGVSNCRITLSCGATAALSLASRTSVVLCSKLKLKRYDKHYETTARN